MSLTSLQALLAMGSPAPSGSQQDPRAAMLGNIGLLVLMVVMFYFVLIRPQQKKQKEHAQLLKSVKKGDEVVTSGGIVGEVVTVKERTVVLRSMDAKFEVSKAAISEITKRTGESSEG
jgi:preprotein translocase subunit YajC